MTNTTYLNPITWKTESIPAEIIANAESRVAWENDSTNGYKRGIKTELISIQHDGFKTELVPNPRNIDTADTCKVEYWSYTTRITTKIFKNGKEKSYLSTHFLYSRIIEVLEVGGYKNPNN